MNDHQYSFMNYQRRKFIINSSILAGGVLLGGRLKAAECGGLNQLDKISIFHSNDLHNQIDRFQSGAFSGCGGCNNLSTHIAECHPDLILDCGDFLGTNIYRDDHINMIRAMNRIGYDASTIGNNELINGEEYLASLVDHMKFKLINCNYTFSNWGLKEAIVPFWIKTFGNYRVGITGIGPELETKGPGQSSIQFSDPYQKANEVAEMLKKKSDLVICLSHLGLSEEDKFNNIAFARQSRSIDIIISGHKKNIDPSIRVFRNASREEVIVSHCSEAGLTSRKLTVSFDQYGKKNRVALRNYASVNSAEHFSTSFRKLKSL